MRQRSRAGQRRPVGEGVREPGAGSSSEERGARMWIVAGVRLPQRSRTGSRGARLRRTAVVGETRTKQRFEPFAPCVVHGMQTDGVAYAFLVEAQQRLDDMAGARRRARRQLGPLVNLELEPAVELAEIMQERKNRQPRLGHAVQTVLPCCSLEPVPQHRIAKQRLEACRDIRAVVFQPVKADRRLELPPRVASGAIFHGTGSVPCGRHWHDRQAPPTACVTMMALSAVGCNGQRRHDVGGTVCERARSSHRFSRRDSGIAP